MEENLSFHVIFILNGPFWLKGTVTQVETDKTELPLQVMHRNYSDISILDQFVCHCKLKHFTESIVWLDQQRMVQF